MATKKTTNTKSFGGVKGRPRPSSPKAGIKTGRYGCGGKLK